MGGRGRFAASVGCGAAGPVCEGRTPSGAVAATTVWARPAGARGSVAVRPVRVDLVDRRQRDERSAGGFLDRLAPAGEPVADREHAADVVALVAERLERPDGRAAGR